MNKTLSLLLTAMVTATLSASCSKPEQKQEPAAAAQKTEATAAAPVSDEIKLGQTMPYSGPASAYGAIGKAQAAYINMINKQGGIGGKKINLISLDDSYSPPKTVEQVRKLVEQEKVVAVFSPVGTAGNSAIHKYLNTKEVPHLFVASGATKWNDPKNFPWTIGFTPSYFREGTTYAEHILKNTPKAKVAVLYQNDDFGKDLLEGLKHGLGENASKIIVAEATYEMSDPTVDSQLVTLKGSKADTIVLFSTPKFTAQAIRKIDDLNWKPANRYISNASASVGSTLTPAGLERSKGLLTIAYTKDPLDKQWENDQAVKDFLAFMKTEMPEADVKDGLNLFGYITGQALVQVLKQCEGDFSGKNIIKQAASLKDWTSGLLQNGITVNTSATDYELFEKLSLSRFNGEKWAPIDATATATN